MIFFDLDEPSTEKVPSQSPAKLSVLSSLRWISIDGSPLDLHLMNEILISSPSLSMLIINMKYFLQLLQLRDEQSCLTLLQTRIKHLSIQLSDEDDLHDRHIERLSQVFSNVRHLIVEHKISDVDIEESLVRFCRSFENHQLISMIIRGRTTEQLRLQPSQWLIDRTNIRRPFQVECDLIEFKIWL